jgi:hypothetical protein
VSSPSSDRPGDFLSPFSKPRPSLPPLLPRRVSGCIPPLLMLGDLRGAASAGAPWWPRDLGLAVAVHRGGGGLAWCEASRGGGGRAAVFTTAVGYVRARSEPMRARFRPGELRPPHPRRMLKVRAHFPWPCVTGAPDLGPPRSRLGGTRSGGRLADAATVCSTRLAGNT